MSVKGTPHGLSGRSSWVWALALAATIVFASHFAAAAPRGLRFPGADKVVHVALYGLLATSIIRSLPDRWAPGIQVMIAAMAASFFGALDEWHQGLVPHRQAEFADWVADTAGGIVAAVAYRYWPAYRRLLEWKVLLSSVSRRKRRRLPGGC